MIFILVIWNSVNGAFIKLLTKQCRHIHSFIIVEIWLMLNTSATNRAFVFWIETCENVSSAACQPFSLSAFRSNVLNVMVLSFSSILPFKIGEVIENDELISSCFCIWTCSKFKCLHSGDWTDNGFNVFVRVPWLW